MYKIIKDCNFNCFNRKISIFSPFYLYNGLAFLLHGGGNYIFLKIFPRYFLEICCNELTIFAAKFGYRGLMGYAKNGIKYLYLFGNAGVPERGLPRGAKLVREIMINRFYDETLFFNGLTNALYHYDACEHLYSINNFRNNMRVELSFAFYLFLFYVLRFRLLYRFFIC